VAIIRKWERLLRDGYDNSMLSIRIEFVR
jgi:hypothetical protein